MRKVAHMAFNVSHTKKLLLKRKCWVRFLFKACCMTFKIIRMRAMFCLYEYGSQPIPRPSEGEALWIDRAPLVNQKPADWRVSSPAVFPLICLQQLKANLSSTTQTARRLHLLFNASFLFWAKTYAGQRIHALPVVGYGANVFPCFGLMDNSEEGIQSTSFLLWRHVSPCQPPTLPPPHTHFTKIAMKWV